ncbi:hypothetical protein ABZW10_05140 [Kitasatospora sp. NPDC004723]|uniref:hypothetical protein n=1 Tax=Kitasatospora sp. NPDC004723 TaxID=3154288 RepID=UPI0033A7E42A
MPNTTPAGEPTHSWLITLQFPIRNGFAVVTRHGSSVLQPGSSRERAYLGIRDYLARREPELADADVLFFSLESYRL